MDELTIAVRGRCDRTASSTRVIQSSPIRDHAGPRQESTDAIARAAAHFDSGRVISATQDDRFRSRDGIRLSIALATGNLSSSVMWKVVDRYA